MPRRRRSRGGSGGLSRRAALALIGAGGFTAVGASGAFDSVSADRRFNLPVGGGNELIGIDAQNPTGNDGDTVTLLTLYNRFPEPIESLSVEVISEPSSISLDIEDPLDRGEAFDTADPLDVSATVSCSETTTERVELEIVATGESEEVRTTTSTNITCRTGGRGVCAVPSIPGCVETEFPPSGSTDCSVEITTGEFDEELKGNTDIGGALVIDASDEADLVLGGSASIGNHVRMDSSDDITFDIGGNASIGGVLQLVSEGAIDAEIKQNLPDGICFDGAGAIGLNVSGGSSVSGPVSVTSEDDVDVVVSDGSDTGSVSVATPADVTVDLSGGTSLGSLDIENGSEVELSLDQGGNVIDGSATVTASDEVDIELNGNEQLNGDLSVTGDDHVALTLDGSSQIDGDVSLDTTGDVTVEVLGNASITSSLAIETEGEVSVDLDGSSNVSGHVTITTGDDVEVELDGTSTIDGDLSIDTDGDIDVSNCSSVGGTVTPDSAC